MATWVWFQPFPAHAIVSFHSRSLHSLHSMHSIPPPPLEGGGGVECSYATPLEVMYVCPGPKVWLFSRFGGGTFRSETWFPFRLKLGILLPPPGYKEGGLPGEGASCSLVPNKIALVFLCSLKVFFDFDFPCSLKYQERSFCSLVPSCIFVFFLLPAGNFMTGHVTLFP